MTIMIGNLKKTIILANLRMTIVIATLRMTIMITTLGMTIMITNLRMTIMIANLRVPIVTICQFHVVMFRSIHHITGKYTGKPKKKNEKSRIHHSVVVIISKTYLVNSVLTEVIVNTDSENIHEATVVSSIFTYLKELNKKGQ